MKEAELLNDRIQTLDSIQSYIGTFFSKEYVLKNVLHLNDGEISEMQDQIKKENETDVDDGGIEVPDGGDGVTRYPQDGSGGVVDPESMPDYEDPKYDGEVDDKQKFDQHPSANDDKGKEEDE